ncbi:DUF5906 domain-containing protein [Kitasatospora sp. NPDC098652]|uniref:DUF5906 domain-containing protein n=1 Tax=Kitasatospora sp. NPDC098652 TaxID=3364095 RepID=UPI00382D494D
MDGQIGGKTVLGNLTTSKSVYTSVVGQLAAYAHADDLITVDRKIQAFPKVDAGAVLHITPARAEFRPVGIDRPVFDRFLTLRRRFTDDRASDAGITGSTAEQAFAVLVGVGANGKLVFLDTLSYVFDALGETTRFETFEDRGSSIPADLAALRGARMVMASEGEAGTAMSESVLKRATGSDKLTARFMRENLFTYQPSLLLWLASNHTPASRSQTPACGEGPS